jgi:ankyrin repeat protein
MSFDARAGRIAAAVAAAMLVGCAESPFEAAQDGAEAVRAALDAKGDPDRRDDRGNTILHVAVLRQDPEMLEVILRHKASVDLANGAHQTALGLASENGCAACVLELLEAHADPNAPQGPQASRPIVRAAANGSLDVVRLLLAFGADANAAEGDGQRALHVVTGADMYRAVAVTKLLVDHGADPKATDAFGETPMHKAAEHDSTEVVDFYAARGVDLDAPNDWGATPLDRAVEARRDRAMEDLVRLGAHTAVTAHFEPPLVAAARTDDTVRVRWLLSFGADPRRPFDGKSPIDVARESGSREALDLLLATSAAQP